MNTSFASNMEDIFMDADFRLSNKFNTQQDLRVALLTDMTRLPEIYDFRLKVWEHSGKNEFVNRQLYPDGWYDQLDLSAFHWVVINEQNKIIASARLNLFNSFDEFPYYLSVKNLSLPHVMPFAFFSRLVVHPHYRQNGLSRQLFTSRSIFCEERGIIWSQVFINNEFIMNQFDRSGYKNIGEAQIAYHPCANPHSVNVFTKEHDYFSN
ncbi:MAG TPA: GNAT family N-acetyltransferase [Hanamia sp.]